MTKTADYLAASRAAHQHGKSLLKQGKADEAQTAFQVALKSRLQARKADPNREDSAWLEDAKPAAPAPGEKIRRYHRVPGLTVEEVAAQKDAELERYFREQLGQAAYQPKAIKVRNPEIVTPKQWIIVKPGNVDEDGRLLCKQRHLFQLLAFDRRTCQGCGQVEELRETKAREDTDAFKQLQKERS